MQRGSSAICSFCSLNNPMEIGCCCCCYRYVFYVREQQQLALLQAHAGQNAESGVDLVGYVEFQRNFK